MNISLDRIELPGRDLRAHVDEDALDELAASLRDHGQLQPIGVRAIDGERFEVVFGARRTRAARLLKLTEIRADIIEDTATSSSHAKKLIENVQRLDMTPIEEAYGLLDLIGDGAVDLRELQRQTGKGRQWIQTRLELAALPEDLQGAVQAGVISIGVARAFGTISNPEVREQYLKSAIENGCTADQAQIWAHQAQFAESGIMAMTNYASADNVILQTPQVVDQQYSCFICAQLQSWRRVNTLVVCGTCQDAIATTRTPAETDPIDNPLVKPS